MRLSRKSDRAARWPPTPSSLQRPLSAATSLGGFGSTAELKPDVSTAIAGRVDPFIRARKSGGPLHSGAGPDIQQAYENHGPLAPTPFTYGFLPESKMPPSPPPPPPIELLAEPVAPTATGARGGRRTKKDEEAEKAAAEMQRMLASRLPPSEPKPKPLRVVYAHVRGKCIPVPVGGGKQVSSSSAEAAGASVETPLLDPPSLPSPPSPYRLYMHTLPTRLAGDPCQSRRACSPSPVRAVPATCPLPAFAHSLSTGSEPRRARAT